MSSHLWASVQNESASSTPSSSPRCSGQSAATPAQAASTCTHAPCSRATPAIARTGSTAPVPVVPIVGHTSTGRRPAATSALTRAASASGDMLAVPREVATTRSARAPRPATRRSLGQRGVGLGGDVDALPAVDALVPPSAGARSFLARAAVQRRDQRDQRRRRRRVGDRATPAAREREAVVEPERAGEAVEKGLLDLGARRGGRPEHPLTAQAARQEVAEQRGERGVGGEVAVEPGVLPVQVAGATTRSTASSRVSSGCGCSGSRSGSPARTCPGMTSGRTGRSGSAAR